MTQISSYSSLRSDRAGTIVVAGVPGVMRRMSLPGGDRGDDSGDCYVQTGPAAQEIRDHSPVVPNRRLSGIEGYWTGPGSGFVLASRWRYWNPNPSAWCAEAVLGTNRTAGSRTNRGLDYRKPRRVG